MNCTGLTSENISPTLTYGWVKQPNIRGTLDILLSCALTFFICGWSCICPNVPSPEHLKWDIIRDKWHLFCLAVLGPEFVFLLALGQYMKARESVKDFHELGHEEWTLKHGFFADMGGFVLRPNGWKQFPITSKQLHYLIKHGYVHYPSINQDFITDKNKADGLARTITICQITWFLVNIIARVEQRLAVTTLEITTAAFIFCTFGTFFCWLHKPMDVEIPLVLETEVTVDQILLDAGPIATKPYRQTPLDFIDREGWMVTALWEFCVNLLRNMHVVHQRPKVRPMSKVSSFNFPKLSSAMLGVPVVVTFAYCAFFLAAWNCHFPTGTERFLWRFASTLQMGLSVVGGLVELVTFARQEAKNHHTALPISLKRSHPVSQYILPMAGGTANLYSQPNKSLLGWMRGLVMGTVTVNNSPDHDPMYDVQLHSLVVTTPICAMYVICRWFVLAEDILSLRSLPGSAFQNVEWSNYLPHF